MGTESVLSATESTHRQPLDTEWCKTTLFCGKLVENRGKNVENSLKLWKTCGKPEEGIKTRLIEIEIKR